MKFHRRVSGKCSRQRSDVHVTHVGTSCTAAQRGERTGVLLLELYFLFFLLVPICLLMGFEGSWHWLSFWSGSGLAASRWRLVAERERESRLVAAQQAD